MPGSGRGAEKGLVGSKTNQGRVNRMGRAVGRDLPVEVDSGGRLTSGKTRYMEGSLSWGGGPPWNGLWEDRIWAGVSAGEASSPGNRSSCRK